MKFRYTVLVATMMLLAVAACTPSTPTDSAMQDAKSMPKQAPKEEAMADTAMDDSHTMTETETMTENEVMTDTMMDDSHAMTETEAMTDTAMSDKSMESEKAIAEDSAMMELPAWMTIPLTNARTGETMTLADLKGKTVFVETMATWCPNCRTQLGNVKAAHAKNSNPDIVFVAISVETDLSAAQLAQYADDNGFNWFFAVSSPELLVELANAFGQTIANPPATPHFVIKADGTVGSLVTGFEDGDAILAGLRD